MAELADAADSLHLTYFQYLPALKCFTVIRAVIVSFMGLYRRSESAVWWMSYTLNGTQHRVSSGTTDTEQAKRQLSERITFKKAPDKRSVSALLDNLVANYRINGQSVEWCEQYRKRPCPRTFFQVQTRKFSMVRFGTGGFPKHFV
jgi:hypothetical protein